MAKVKFVPRYRRVVGSFRFATLGHPKLDPPVNKRNLSTGENGEFRAYSPQSWTQAINAREAALDEKGTSAIDVRKGRVSGFLDLVGDQTRILAQKELLPDHRKFLKAQLKFDSKITRHELAPHYQ